ncbi:MAG: translocation/assembly module TamB domain-containing protein [Alphaproteobacteria bacterium]
MRILWLLALMMMPFAAQAQESDKDFLTRFLQDNLSAAGREVRITGFAGALSAQATMAQMTIADDEGIWLTVKDVTLDWSRSALLSGRIVIDQFSAAEIDLVRMPNREPARPSPEARGFNLPNLPVAIDIRSIAAPHIVLGPTVLGQALEGSLIASAQLAGGEGKASLSLKRNDQGPSGEFGLSAEYVAASGALSLDLIAREGPGGIAVTLLGVPGAPSAEVSIKGAGPISDFRAEVALRTEGVLRLGGQVTTFQTVDASGFEAQLSGDPTPVFLPQYAEFFGPDVRLEAKGKRYADGRIELSALHLAVQALQLDGMLNLDAGGVPTSFSLTGRVGLPEGPVVLPLTTEGETRLQNADLVLNYSQVAGEVWQGKATLKGLDHANFTAADAVLAGSGHIISDAAGARFDGRIDFGATGLVLADPALAKALGDALTGQAVLNWQTGGKLQVSDLSLAGDGYEVATTGAIGGFAERFALTGTARGRYDDLTRLADLTGRKLKGALAFDLTGNGSPLTGMADLEGSLRGTDLEVGLAQLDGLMAGDTAITASVKRDETGTRLRRLDLTARGFSAKAEGMLTSDGVDLTGDFDLADLAVLGAGYGGALRGKGRFNGPMAAGLITLQADGTDLAIGQIQLDGLLRGASRVDLALRLNAGGAAVEAADVSFAKGRLTATGQVGMAASDVTARVALTDLTALNFGLRGAATGDLRFTGAADMGRLTVQAQAQGLKLGQNMLDPLLRGASTLKADLDLTPQGIGITQLDLNNGQISVTTTGRVTGAERRLQLQARLADLGLLYPQFPGPLVVEGTATQTAARGYVLDLTAKGPGQIDARIKGTMANSLGTVDLAIAGTATAGLANIVVAPRSLSGPLKYDLRMRGPIGLNAISGTVTLSGGRVADPAVRVGLRDVNGTAQLANGQARITAEGNATTSGNLTINGTVGLTPPMPADLAVSLNAFGLRDPDLYTTEISGAVTLRGALLAGAMLEGRLTLGRTELRIPSTGFGGDATLENLRHVNEPAASLETRRRAGQLQQTRSAAENSSRLELNLQISAPRQVFIRGRGLDAELGGNLSLRGTTAAMVPSGSFKLIRGRLEILGRRLQITEALLQLQGAFVPYVRIMASVKSDDITASVLIEGDASEPRITFTSIPELPSEEVLARLLFNRSLATLTAFQALQLGSAVATLAGTGGNGILDRLRKNAGLDNLDVSADAKGNTTVKVGKYLSEKIYSEVEVRQGKSAVSLNLDVTPNITLRAEVDSDQQTGVGIFLQRDY